MIQFSHLYKNYRGTTSALRDVNLYIEKGEFVFLTGPSGAGKTTLFRMVSAFDKPTSGRALVAGYDLCNLSAQELPFFRRRVGIVFQDFRLLKDRNVFENVALPLEITGEKMASTKRKVDDMLERVGLRFKAEAFPEELSGGEQQRVAIARSLVHQPGVLVADEPTGNLDPEMSRNIMDLLERVNAQGTTVFVATHDRQLVSERRHRVLHIEHGELKEVTGV
jgi:cell division transport system ATP-binding protein